MNESTPPPEPSEEDIRALHRFIEDASTDPKLAATIKHLIVDVAAQKQATKDMLNMFEKMRCALGTFLRHKFAPHRVTRREIKSYPQGWSIEIDDLPARTVEDIAFTVRFVVPNSSIVVVPKENINGK